mgnify:CR=1 FL=1
MTLLLDVTSLLERRYQPVLTGIDRVEFALADWLCHSIDLNYKKYFFVINNLNV